jgi:dienelactone hydrolase
LPLAGTTARSIRVTLVERDAMPREMVHVEAGSRPVYLDSFDPVPIALDRFFIDRHEVTNREFKEFVDAGAYATERYWIGLRFVKGGRELSWKEAVALFVDGTGRPGPATWELSDYPQGLDDHPVGGVSWYEAAAYAAFRGKALPTVYHWARATLSPDATSAMIRLSNFSGKGTTAVGSLPSVGPYGTLDSAGNVREWVWNASGDNRWILGGAWNEPAYVTTSQVSLPPFDRSAENGFRCVTYASKAPLPDALTGPLAITVVDHRSRKPVSDELFAVIAKQFAYEPGPLDARVESTNESNRDYVWQRISFEAGYDKARTPLHLFLPRNSRPPFRTVVFYPGASAFQNPGPSDQWLTILRGPEEFVYKSGMALAIPVYDGAYERWRPPPALTGPERARHDRTGAAHRRQDIGRTLDYLQTREDVQQDTFIYFGFSRGGAALMHAALENRFRTAILISGGVPNTLPEVDALNYAPRLTIPVLMLNGRYDHIFPVETSQKPLFDNLGAPPSRKRHVIYEAGHFPLPRSEWIREALAWLDKYAPSAAASPR